MKATEKGNTMRKTLALAAASLWLVSAAAQTGPYAGQQLRPIKSLSEADVAELLAGQGMGLAKAAELNGYPGPAHVLEHADALALSGAQHHATRALLDQHKARARELGAEVIEAERALDEAFAHRQIDEAALARLTAAIGHKQAQLRREHLQTHLAQTTLLDPAQRQRYAVLRGYAPGAPGTGDTGSGSLPNAFSHRNHH